MIDRLLISSGIFHGERKYSVCHLKCTYCVLFLDFVGQNCKRMYEPLNIYELISKAIKLLSLCSKNEIKSLKGWSDNTLLLVVSPFNSMYTTIDTLYPCKITYNWMFSYPPV